MAKRLEQGDEDLTWKVNAGSLEVRNLVTALRGTAATLLDNTHALIDANAMLAQKVQARTAELAKANNELQILARRDTLTNIGERLREEYLRSQRTHRPCCVLMLDVDYFKRVNSSLRGSNFAGRFGGEEFLVLLPDTPMDTALGVAEKIRAAVQAQQQSEVGHITINLGGRPAECERCGRKHGRATSGRTPLPSQGQRAQPGGGPVACG
jgi:GGDEF domain-containing protein